MKVKSEELFSLIREIVRDELKKELPKVLSEQYIRKMIISEGKTRVAGKQTLKESLEVEETAEEPTPMRPAPMPQRIVKSKLLDKTNPLSFIYDDVKPINEGASAAPSVDVDRLAEAGFDFERMASQVRAMEHRSPSTSNQNQAQNEYELKMRQLEEKRKALEIPAR